MFSGTRRLRDFFHELILYSIDGTEGVNVDFMLGDRTAADSWLNSGWVGFRKPVQTAQCRLPSSILASPVGAGYFFPAPTRTEGLGPASLGKGLF